jgi:hypothetical protein
MRNDGVHHTGYGALFVSIGWETCLAQHVDLLLLPACRTCRKVTGSIGRKLDGRFVAIPLTSHHLGDLNKHARRTDGSCSQFWLLYGSLSRSTFFSYLVSNILVIRSFTTD